VQTSPTDCGVSECDREASTGSRPRPKTVVHFTTCYELLKDPMSDPVGQIDRLKHPKTHPPTHPPAYLSVLPTLWLSSEMPI